MVVSLGNKTNNNNQRLSTVNIGCTGFKGCDCLSKEITPTTLTPETGINANHSNHQPLWP